MFRHASVFGGESEDSVHGFEQLFRIGVRHFDFVGRVLAEFAGHVTQALPGICLLAERGDGETGRNVDSQETAPSPKCLHRSSLKDENALPSILLESGPQLTC